MKCKVSLETALLTWLGGLSIVLALLGMLVSLADPVALVVSCVALILGGVSTIGGKTRLASIVAVIVALNIVAVAYSYSSSTNAPMYGFLAVMFAPAYLIAYGLSLFGRWRLRRAARLNCIAAQSGDG